MTFPNSHAAAAIAALAFAIPASATAQAPHPQGQPAAAIVSPGDRIVNGAALPLGVHEVRLVAVKDGAEREVGTMRDEITASTAHGKPALLRVTSVQMPRGTILDSTLVLRATLAPVWHHGRTPAHALHLEFGADRATGTVTPPDSAAAPVDQPIPHPYFDSAVIDLVIAALPLADGYAARIPAYVYERGGLVWVDVSVTGRETVGGREAWKAEMKLGEVTLTWLVDVKSRAVLGYSRAMPGGEMRAIAVASGGP